MKSNINKIKLITIDGITCSGKTLFSKILKKKVANSILVSKDLFLISRTKRISIAKSLKKKIYNQNNIHYDLPRINLLISFLIKGNEKNKLILKKLYNRRSGVNNVTKTFYFKTKRFIIYEGIYANDDLKKIIKPSSKILLTEDVYLSLLKKIKRIRDKKISIENLVTEFINIHLNSFLKYLKRNDFDEIYANCKKKFFISKNGKKKQINDIIKFFNKHQN
jgi:uridine kinase